MPWTIDKVDEHKKGLSDEQKKKWVRIANSVLKRCENKKGKDCEAVAIRTANSKINANKQMIAVNFLQETGYMPEIKEHEGRSYYVVPVVMMVEGVHNGSAGAVYHSKEELGKSVEYWNNMPVTISHPETDEGSFVSANSEEVLESYGVGFVHHAYMDDEKLKAEIYVDIEFLSAMSPEAYNAIQNGQILEVSVGIFTDDENTKGKWNNEEYIKIARNHRPDHLALLPGETGACSVKDGCGVRVNNEEKKGGKNVNLVVLKDLIKDGLVAVPIIYKEGLYEHLSKLQSLLNAMDTNEIYHYMEEAYDDYLVYSKSSKDGRKLYKQSYQNNNGTLEFTGDPVEVQRKISYVTVNKNDTKMCEPCKEKVNELIANTSTNLTENDREWLETLSEDKLDLFIPKVIEVNAQLPTLDEAIKVIQANNKTLEDYMGLLPVEMREKISDSLALFEESKQNTVKAILDNTEDGTWKEEDLKVMSLSVLKKIEKSIVKRVVDYSVRGTVGTSDVSKVPPLILGN
jgi:hypothetical protein